MSTKKQKGFTLIELLAVIVILAIIALIATPIILNIVEKARKSAFQDSAYGLIEAAKLQYVEGILDGSNSTATYIFDGTTNSGLEFSGSVPEGGQVIVDSEGNVGVAIYSNGMCALKGTKESTVNVIDYDASTCIVPDAAKDPMIELIGDREITLYVGDTYTEEGATAKTVDGTSLTYTITITKEGNVETSVDTSAVGEYTITYTAVNNNKTASVIRSLSVKKVVCKRAKVETLHTEICSQTSNYCYAAGYANGTTMSYGNETITAGTLTSGDAYDCDVNGDGTYDATTERFYYVSDLYNTSTKSFDSNYAVLVYYNNTTAGVADNTSASLIQYKSSHETWNGPGTAITNLPKTNQWTNVSLSATTRAILTETGTTASVTSSSSHNLPTAFEYTGYAARLLTAQEIYSACGMTIASNPDGALDTCNYLMENTKYSKSSLTNGYWLENPYSSDTGSAWMVYSQTRKLGRGSAGDTYFAARPAIEVLKTDIEI